MEFEQSTYEIFVYCLLFSPSDSCIYSLPWATAAPKVCGGEIAVCFGPIYIYIYINVPKSADHGTDFKWSIWGGGRIREFDYLHE